MAKEIKDKTKGHQNSKAPAINYPETEKKKGKAKKSVTHDIAPVVKKEHVELEYYFSDSELQEKGLMLATALQEQRKTEDEKKSVADSFKSKIDVQQIEIDALTEQLTVKYEVKTVLCEVKRNFTTMMREYWFKDEKRKEEPLRASDHQIELDLATEGNTKEFDLPLAAGDFVITKKGKTIEITEEDVTNGIQYKSIDRLATQEEIDEFNSNK